MKRLMNNYMESMPYFPTLWTFMCQKALTKTTGFIEELIDVLLLNL